MEKCEYFHERGIDQHGQKIGECWGTKEVERVFCDGNKVFCTEISPTQPTKEDYFTLSRAEIIDIVNDAARKLNKKVPIEFYERLFRDK